MEILLLGSEKPVIYNKAYHRRAVGWLGAVPRVVQSHWPLAKARTFAWIGPNILNITEQTSPQGGVWVLSAWAMAAPDDLSVRGFQLAGL